MIATKSRTPLVIVAVVIVAVVAALVAVVLAGGDDDGDEGDAATPSAAYQAVEVTGTGLAPLSREGGPDPAFGLAAPALVGSDYAGETVEVTPGSDGPLMLVFLAHWCPHCNAELPRLNEWRDSGEVPDDLAVVGVSTAVDDERPNFPPGSWLAENDWTWPVLGDDAALTAAGAYGVSGLPFLVVVGDDGTVLARHSGELSVEELDAFVDTALT